MNRSTKTTRRIPSSTHAYHSYFVPPLPPGHGCGRLQRNPWLRISIHRESKFLPQRILLRRRGEQRRPSRLSGHAGQRRGSWTVLENGSIHRELLSRRCQWSVPFAFIFTRSVLYLLPYSLPPRISTHSPCLSPRMTAFTTSTIRIDQPGSGTTHRSSVRRHWWVHLG